MEDKLIKAVNENWDLSDVKIKKLLKEAGERLVYLIISNEGNFVVKIADSSKTAEDLVFDTEVFEILKTNGFENLPSLIKTKTNTNFTQYDDKFIYIQEYIEGDTPQQNPANYFQFGQVVANLHKIKDYPHKTNFTIDSTRQDLIKNANNVPDKEKYLDLVNNLPDLTNLPESLIHTDIGLHNSIEKPSGEIFIIDWDDAGLGKKILDISFPLVSQFINTDDLVFQEENARAFYKGYQDIGEITSEEKEIIFDVSLFFALMYLPYSDVKENWNRILFSLKNRRQLLSSLDG